MVLQPLILYAPFFIIVLFIKFIYTGKDPIELYPHVHCFVLYRHLEM